MASGRGLYRTCPICGKDYKASRPACPYCGKPPFTRRKYYVMSGPRMLVLLGLLFFLSLALYGLFLPAEHYQKYRALFFGIPQTVAVIVGAIGVAGFSVWIGVALARGRSKGGNAKAR
jgi:hypothetical protein